MEIESRRFYEAAARQTVDAGTRQLLDDLAQEEERHEAAAEEITDAQAASGAISREHDAARRLFVLRFIQPGLAGLSWRGAAFSCDAFSGSSERCYRGSVSSLGRAARRARPARGYSGPPSVGRRRGGRCGRRM